jgi:hypothetical protein
MRFRINYRTVLPIYHLIWKRWRERRFQKMRRIFDKERIIRLLDVGGNPGDWFGRGDFVEFVDSLNLTATPIDNPPPGSPTIRCIAGDGTCLSFTDQSYDMVYSNSVIEHIVGKENRSSYAHEIKRVGLRYWVQTPAFTCPVEPHYLGLFIHWFPRSWQWPLIRWGTFIGLTGAAGEAGLRAMFETTRLLTRKEFQSMFPDAKIWVERFLWIFPKSYVAYKI